MTRHYVLDNKPALARKIVQASEICDFQVDQRIKDLATEDTIPTQYFADDKQRNLVQFLVDSNLRAGIVCANAPWSLSAVFNAIEYAGGGPITVASLSRLVWKSALQERNFKGEAFSNKDNLVINSLRALVETNISYEQRNGVLIIDWVDYDYTPAKAVFLAAKFPKTIILDREHTHIAFSDGSHADDFKLPLVKNLQKTLFPHMHNRYLNEKVSKLISGWKITHPSELAFFYNILFV